MPIIYMPSAVGGAGDAAAAVTQQLNFGMQQMLQLLELQERRKLAQVQLVENQRQFAANMGVAREQFAEEMGFRRQNAASGMEFARDQFAAERADAASRMQFDREQFAAGRSDAAFARSMAQRQLQNQEERDLANLKRSQRDEAFRDQEFAFETYRQLGLDQQNARLVDAQIAAEESRAGAFVADRLTSERGIAGDVAAGLGNRYQVSGSGILQILNDLDRLDQANGTTYAQEADNLLRQISGGEYDAWSSGEAVDAAGSAQAWAQQFSSALDKDPRLGRMFTQVGEAARRAFTQERAQARAGDLDRELGVLARRVEELGDKRLLEQFTNELATSMPEEDASDETFLDYADNQSVTFVRKWNERISLENERVSARDAANDFRRRQPQGWQNQPAGKEGTVGDQLQSIMRGLEMAENVEEVRAARAQLTLLLDPNAKLAAEYMARLGGTREVPEALLPAGMGRPTPLDEKRARNVALGVLADRFQVTNMQELMAAMEDPARKAELEQAVIEALEQAEGERARRLNYRTGF